MTIALNPNDQRKLLASICTTKEREAYELVEFHGYSIRAAAYTLGISNTAARNRIDGARRKLKTYSRSQFPASEPRWAPIQIRDNIDPTVALLMQRDGNLCYLCKADLDHTTGCIEHIIPRSLGGTNDAYNLALSCIDCNSRKGNSIISLLITSGRPVYHLQP